MKTRVLPITLLLLVPLAAAAQTAEEVVKKALDARGGVDKLKAVQSERLTGRISFSRGVEGAFVGELKRPLKMHVEITIEGQKIIRVYDGRSSGWMINPLAGTKDALPLSAEALKNISDESDHDGPQGGYRAKRNKSRGTPAEPPPHSSTPPASNSISHQRLVVLVPRGN